MPPCAAYKFLTGSVEQRRKAPSSLHAQLSLCWQISSHAVQGEEKSAPAGIQLNSIQFGSFQNTCRSGRVCRSVGPVRLVRLVKSILWPVTATSRKVQNRQNVSAHLDVFCRPGRCQSCTEHVSPYQLVSRRSEHLALRTEGRARTKGELHGATGY